MPFGACFLHPTCVWGGLGRFGGVWVEFGWVGADFDDFFTMSNRGKGRCVLLPFWAGLGGERMLGLVGGSVGGMCGGFVFLLLPP